MQAAAREKGKSRFLESIVSRSSSKPSASASTPKQKLKPDEKPEKPLKRKRNLEVATAGEYSRVPKDRRLQCSKVKAKTLALYAKAVEGFLEWKGKRTFPTSSHQVVDNAICSYIHFLCEEGHSVTEASYVVFGWILLKSTWHIPDKLQLPISRQALKGWRARFPGKARTGVDLVLWDLVAKGAIELGFYFCACAIIVQGDSYLRPSEVLAVTSRHLIPPQRHMKCWGLIVGLEEDERPAKNGEYDECVFADTYQRADVNQVLQWLYAQKLDPQTSIFRNLSLQQYESQIAKAASLVGLKSLKLSPHMLRHSGASSDSYYGIRSLKEIQARGRWKAPNSVARYRKPGRMLISQKSVSKKTWKEAEQSRLLVIQALSQFFKKG